MRQSLHSLTRRVMELFVRDTTAGDDDRLDARTGWQPEWGGEHIGRLSGADPASFVHVVGPCGDDSVRSAPFFIPRTICLPPHFCGSPFVSASWCCRNRGQASRASCVCVCVCAYGMVCFAWLSHGWMDGWMGTSGRGRGCTHGPDGTEYMHGCQEVSSPSHSLTHSSTHTYMIYLLRSASPITHPVDHITCSPASPS